MEIDKYIVVTPSLWKELLDYVDRKVLEEGITEDTKEIAGILNAIESMQPKRK